MGCDTLSDNQLRDLLNEGVREQRWKRHRSYTKKLTGWHAHDGYGTPYLDIRGSDQEEAAWAQERASDKAESEELERKYRATHPEWRQPGEDEEAWKARYGEWEKNQRSEWASKAAATAAAVWEATGLDSGTVDTILDKLAEGYDEEDLGFKVSLSSVQEKVEKFWEEENQDKDDD